MRKELTDALLLQAHNSSTVFLTGDLGFMALERLRDVMGVRFINAGIAEQNMISVGASLSRTGLNVWVYSIAPFCYARAFEQIRNDVCFHKLPVKIIGNGGGYGYGVMGPTHHAIEDYGVLLTLPHMSICIPVFNEDVAEAVKFISNTTTPAYLRLGQGVELKQSGLKAPKFKPWRQLTQGNGPLIIAVGPLAGYYYKAFESMEADIRPNIWAVSVLPIDFYKPPAEFIRQMQDAESMVVAEEHVQRGGFCSELLLFLANQGIPTPKNFFHLYARKHIYESYGSQKFLREKSRIDEKSLKKIIMKDAARRP